jgi:GNAT superfamily N-acetyltransferase
MASFTNYLARWLGRVDAPTARPLLGGHSSTVIASGALLEIRTGRPNDVPAVLPMIEQSCALHQRWDLAKFGLVDNFVPMYGKWLTNLASDSRSVFLVTAGDGCLVAFLVGTIDGLPPIYRLSEYGFIRDFWVEQNWRRKGIGRQILRAAITQFKALGVEQVRLETAAGNESARAFFASCGFRASATEMLIETRR